MEIRPLGPADAEAFQALRLRGLQEAPEAFGSTYEEEVDLSPGFVAERLDASRAASERVVLGAYLDGALVGLAGCMRETKRRLRHKASVWGMYVVPEARGRGIGRALLERALAEARGWPGVERVTLSVVERAVAARALYRAMGFRPYGLEPDALRDGAARDAVEYLTLEL